MEYSFESFIKFINKNKVLTLSVIITSFFLCALQFFYRFPVYFLPDTIVLFFAMWALANIKQEVSLGIIFTAIILIGYICFSPSNFDIEYSNSFLVTIKPFLYLLILYLCSSQVLKINLSNLVYSILFIYPIIIIFNIFLWYLKFGFFMTRPNFIFENNFEIPLILICFLIIVYIYKERSFIIYLTLALIIFLTGSRSGLLGFLMISTAYFFTLSKLHKVYFGLALLTVVGYSFYVRGVPELNTNSIDRVQTFYAMLEYYNYSLKNIFIEPFGVGIYQKVPNYICQPFAQFAEWFTGSYFNCDPILFQSFFSRSLYQIGIFGILYIFLAFYIELNKKLGWKLSVLVLIPIFTASLSVGGISNGLSFIAILLVIMTFNQNRLSFENPNS